MTRPEASDGCAVVSAEHHGMRASWQEARTIMLHSKETDRDGRIERVDNNGEPQEVEPAALQNAHGGAHQPRRVSHLQATLSRLTTQESLAGVRRRSAARGAVTGARGL